MANIKDVITALELCTNISQDGCMMLCPYKDEQDETYPGFCEHVLKQDALELLNEQQPMKPDVFNNSYWCGKCDDYIMTVKQARTPIYRQKVRFCCHCGQPIDWQELEQDSEQK